MAFSEVCHWLSRGISFYINTKNSIFIIYMRTLIVTNLPQFLQRIIKKHGKAKTSIETGMKGIATLAVEYGWAIAMKCAYILG